MTSSDVRDDAIKGKATMPFIDQFYLTCIYITIIYSLYCTCSNDKNNSYVAISPCFYGCQYMYTVLEITAKNNMGIIGYESWYENEKE